MEIIENLKGIEFSTTHVSDVIKYNGVYYMHIPHADTNAFCSVPYHNVVDLQAGTLSYINEREMVHLCPHCKLVIE